MKIAFHSYQLGERGTEICLYKYAKYNREILGNESIIISTNSRPTPSLNRFKEFPTYLYSTVWQNDRKNDELRGVLENICAEEKVDAFYAIKGGENDNFMPTNTRRLAHCIFTMDEPHGEVYAGVCKYISDRYGGVYPYVYHIIDKEAPHINDDLKDELGIPKDALVLGRHGGRDVFNIPAAHSAIIQALEKRKDLWIVLLNTDVFYTHERIKYLPWTISEEYKARFINTCDAMIHARDDGEVFSLSVAEFSVRNKPIITWKPDIIPNHYHHGHLDVLKDTAFYYKDTATLVEILLSLTKSDIVSRNWNVYGEQFSPQAIMQQFKDVFLTT